MGKEARSYQGFEEGHDDGADTARSYRGDEHDGYGMGDSDAMLSTRPDEEQGATGGKSPRAASRKFFYLWVYDNFRDHPDARCYK